METALVGVGCLLLGFLCGVVIGIEDGFKHGLKYMPRETIKEFAARTGLPERQRPAYLHDEFSYQPQVTRGISENGIG